MRTAIRTGILLALYTLLSVCLLILGPRPALAQLSAGSQVLWLGWPSFIPLEPETSSGSSVALGDFNCDGIGDLAMGSPNQDLLVTPFPVPIVAQQAGSVTVYYGSAPPESGSAQLLTQLTFGQVPETLDNFGARLAAGDFNNDGCDDLAISSPTEDIGTTNSAGALLVAYGSALGFSDADLLQQGLNGLQGGPEDNDRFGSSLAVGDLNADGVDDLAVGVPLEDLSTVVDAGAVHVLFGTAAVGLTTSGNVLLHRNVGSIPGGLAQGEQFGWRLGTMKNTTEMGTSLLITVPGAEVSGEDDAGAVLRVLDPSNPNASIVAEYHQDTSGIPGIAESGDFFGSAIAAGDFDGNGFVDIAVGVSFEDVTVSAVGQENAGAFNIIYFGSPRPAHQLWTQLAVPDFAPESFDLLGATAVVGDFNMDGISDLAIAAPGENLGTGGNAGVVHVLYGSPGTGLSAVGNQNFSMGTPNPGDFYGQALAAGPFRDGNSNDLVVGVPGRTFQGVERTGIALTHQSLIFFADGFESGDLSAWTP